MLPLSFSDLADAPTIVSSPHQHQFDPITSRAAHSVYYHHQQSCKPLMPSRHWDHPIAMSKSTPITGNPATKRSRTEQEEETHPSGKLDLSTKTPHSSPTNADAFQTTTLSPNSMSSPAPFGQPSLSSPPGFLNKSARSALDTTTTTTDDYKKPPPYSSSVVKSDYASTDSQAKRARVQDGDEQYSAHTYPDGSTEPWESRAKAYDGSNELPSVVDSTNGSSKEGSAQLQNPDSTWGAASAAQPQGQDPHNHQQPLQQTVDQSPYLPSSPNLSRHPGMQQSVHEHGDEAPGGAAEEMDLD